MATRATAAGDRSAHRWYALVTTAAGRPARSNPSGLGDGVAAAEVDDEPEVAVAVVAGGSSGEARRDVVGGHRCLAGGVLRGGRAGRAGAGGEVGHGRGVAEREHLRAPGHREVGPDDQPAVLGRGVEVPHERAGRDAGGPDQGRGGETASVGERHGLVVRGGQARHEIDVDPAGLEHPPRVVAETVAHAGQEPVVVLHDVPLHERRVETGEPPRERGGHQLHVRRGLDPRVAPAHDDEAAPPRTLVGVGGGVGDLELGQHVIAQERGLGERLAAPPVLPQPRDLHDLRDAARREHQPVVGEHVVAAGDAADEDPARIEVDARRPPGQQRRALQPPRQRHHRGPRCQHAGRHLGQQREVEHVVVGADETDVGVRRELLQPPRHARAGEAPADDDHAFAHAVLLSTPPPPDVRESCRLPATARNDPDEWLSGNPLTPSRSPATVAVSAVALEPHHHSPIIIRGNHRACSPRRSPDPSLPRRRPRRADAAGGRRPRCGRGARGRARGQELQRLPVPGGRAGGPRRRHHRPERPGPRRRRRGVRDPAPPPGDQRRVDRRRVGHLLGGRLGHVHAASSAGTTWTAADTSDESSTSTRDRDCADFDSQAEAQAVLDDDPSDPERLDADDDGIACESFGYADEVETVPAAVTEHESAPTTQDSTPAYPVGGVEAGDGSAPAGVPDPADLRPARLRGRRRRGRRPPRPGRRPAPSGLAGRDTAVRDGRHATYFPPRRTRTPGKH